LRDLGAEFLRGFARLRIGSSQLDVTGCSLEISSGEGCTRSGERDATARTDLIKLAGESAIVKLERGGEIACREAAFSKTERYERALAKVDARALELALARAVADRDLQCFRDQKRSQLALTGVELAANAAQLGGRDARVLGTTRVPRQILEPARHELRLGFG